ncbi:MAG TPA: nucleoside-diphosphate sugar epimerase/dehydratase, partial [Chitinophagaceae bacterium]|nr:nucleoside-diphosphate sugar epimerase/dehydratase [Chitinophagaceae bacterium]
VLIYGSDINSVLIKRAIESSDGNLSIAGFIETNSSKTNIYIEQKKVFSIKVLKELKNKLNISKLILMNVQLTDVKKKLVIEHCLQLGIKVLTVPPYEQWISDTFLLKQMQELKIEDLLQRDKIVIRNNKIGGEISGKRILVTGAAGSIGSEIVRQVLSFHPGMVILCDQAESALYDMQLEIEEKYPDANIKVFIGSVRDYHRMEIPFKKYSPDIVFHAAALKHVPMMEHHPSEAVLTNVIGTKNLAELAVLYKAYKFVMISTDKAVNPANVMGASKRIAEMYVQSLNRTKKHFQNTTGETKFITTRFGNVLGSNGSVIPRFREQILKGGPVTVTDPEITRFFMTIPEAVQLVLEAGTMGEGGEIYVFDMGKPVRILDLAKKMIQLVGLIPDKDIKITFTGLRQGEKLYEELLNVEEKTLPTHHEKIKIALTVPCPEKIVWHINQLFDLSIREDNLTLVRKMKEIVPEFKSCNSKYERLDTPQLNKTLHRETSDLVM